MVEDTVMSCAAKVVVNFLSHDIINIVVSTNMMVAMAAIMNELPVGSMVLW